MFHRDIQTPRMKLKIAEYFDKIRDVWIAEKHYLECLIYLLKRDKNCGVNGEIKS